MLGKYIIDRGVGPSPMMRVEVWEDNGHCVQPRAKFPYDLGYWLGQDKRLKRRALEVGISPTFEDALRKATEFYNSLGSIRAPDRTIVIGRRLD